MNQLTTPSPTDNIEPFARYICERDLRRTKMPEAELTAAVDRYWHCVAAYIEGGFIDDRNELVLHDHEGSLAAYHDWCERHIAR